MTEVNGVGSECRAPAESLGIRLQGLDLADQAALFKALGDEVRLTLLHLVRDQEVCVCDLIPMLGMAQSTLSHHLGILHRAGLVSMRKQGRWNYYRATDLAEQAHPVFATASQPMKD